MKKYVNGQYIELTADELTAMEAEARKARQHELTRPRTMEEGILELNRTILADKLAQTEDKTLAIACMAFFEPWKPGAYVVGDIRTDPETGYPRECMIAHDSTVNPDWTIQTASIWKPYHSRKKEYALPWEQPTGAHDMYKAGEYMIWTDYEVYRCKMDTNFSPADYADAWEKEK
jgi:hypothetical protein